MILLFALQILALSNFDYSLASMWRIQDEYFYKQCFSFREENSVKPEENTADTFSFIASTLTKFAVVLRFGPVYYESDFPFLWRFQSTLTRESFHNQRPLPRWEIIKQWKVTAASMSTIYM